MHIIKCNHAIIRILKEIHIMRNFLFIPYWHQILHVGHSTFYFYFCLLLYNKQFWYCVCFCIFHVCIWQMLSSKENLSNNFYEFLLSVGIEPITFGVARKHALLLESATWYPLSILGFEPKPLKNYWFSPLFVNCTQWFYVTENISILA